MNLKRLFAISSLALATLAIGCSSQAEVDATEDQVEVAKTAPLARFAPYLRTLKSAIEEPATIEAAADALLAQGRPAAFSLQALARVYGGFDGAGPEFRTLHDAFKSLEDGIGAYDKWAGIYDQAVSEHADKATLDRLEKKRDEARTLFTTKLTRDGWRTEGKSPTRLAQIQKFLDGYKWKPRAGDREQILAWISKELTELDTTRYDMKTLEQGNGLHELRRDLRWILIEQLTLNGLVTLKDAGDKCPAPALAKIPNDNRYGALRGSALETRPCEISACLVFATADFVERLGDLKDQAEQAVNIAGDSDVVPQKLQAATQSTYDEITKSHLLGLYRDEIETCREQNKKPY